MSDGPAAPAAAPDKIEKPKHEGKALVPVGTFAHAMEPKNMEELISLSNLLAKSDLVPKDFQGKPANIVIAVSLGREVGVGWAQAVQNIAVINGRPAVWGDAALALVQNRADCEDISETIDGVGDARTATCTIKRKGRSVVVRTFSVAQAKTAGLWGKAGPWTQYPDRMLPMRARGFAIRDAFPDALRGLNLAEELQGSEIDVTPARSEAPAATARPALDGLPDDEFAAKMAKWKPLVENGSKTAQEMLDFATTKWTLSADQKAKVLALAIADAVIVADPVAEQEQQA